MAVLDKCSHRGLLPGTSFALQSVLEADGRPELKRSARDGRLHPAPPFAPPREQKSVRSWLRGGLERAGSEPSVLALHVRRSESTRAPGRRLLGIGRDTSSTRYAAREALGGYAPSSDGTALAAANQVLSSQAQIQNPRFSPRIVGGVSVPGTVHDAYRTPPNPRTFQDSHSAQSLTNRFRACGRARDKLARCIYSRPRAARGACSIRSPTTGSALARNAGFPRCATKVQPSAECPRRHLCSWVWGEPFAND
jgi:hypothetical protein